MEPTDPNQMVVTIDATWTADNVNYMETDDLANMEATMTTTYNYSLTQMSLAGPADTDDIMADPMFEAGQFPYVTARSRYVSLDCDRPDPDFLLPLERRHSLANDAKESAKEVSNLPSSWTTLDSLLSKQLNVLTNFDSDEGLRIVLLSVLIVSGKSKL